MVASLSDHGAEETKTAIEAAHQALKGWRQTSVKERSKLLRKWYQLLVDHQDDLALLMTREQGKPLAEAKGEILYGANYIEWFAEEAKRIYGDTIAPPSQDRRIICIKQPVGVVASITPWNFPNAMIARKAGPALAAGCTFVAKPAAETPLSALAMAALAEEAGIPPGVFNVVVGSNSQAIGGEMTSNPLVRKVTFTGSTGVGKILIKQCADTVKKTSMELGGNAPFVVFDDADLEAAVNGAMASKFRNAGQTCICANRFLVQEGIYDDFVKALAAKVSELKVGYGLEKGVTMGPLINDRAVNDVDGMVQDAIQKGGKALCGGKKSDRGFGFYEPTILTNVTKDMRVFREEIFGPVAPIFKFKTEEEAVALANDTEFGLAAYIYTSNVSRLFRVSEEVEYGIVGVNEGAVSNEMAPFGGVKESGSGREGSKYGIEDYVEIKYMCLGGINP